MAEQEIAAAPQGQALLTADARFADPEIEARFRAGQLAAAIPQARFGVMLLAGAVLVFSAGDILLADTGGLAALLIAFRIALAAGGLWLILRLKARPSAELLDQGLLAFMLGTGLIFVVSAATAGPAGFNLSLLAPLLVAAFFFLLPATFNHQAAGALLVTAGFIWTALTEGGELSWQIRLAVPILIALMVIMAVAAWRLQQVRREQFVAFAELQMVMSASPYPVIVTERFDGLILFVNDAAAARLGLALDHILRQPVAALFERVDGGQHPATDSDFFGKAQRLEAEFQTKQGDRFWAIATANPLTYGGLRAVLLTLVDISDRRKLEEELRVQASVDALTGVANRRRFSDTGTREVARALRYRKPLSLLMLDVDHFKKVNDTYGHGIGDEALKAMARTCQGELRATDLLGRLGGEEFAIILPETEPKGALEVAERVRVAISNIEVPLDNDGVLKFTASIGMAHLAPKETLEQLLERADSALYRAKQTGRNKVVEVGS